MAAESAYGPAPFTVEDNAVLQDYVGLSESRARDLAQAETPLSCRPVTGSVEGNVDFVRGRINADVRGCGHLYR